jgi:rod shape-determining protein MreC
MITVFLLSVMVAGGKYKISFLDKTLAVVLSPFEYALFSVTDGARRAVSFSGDIIRVYRDNQNLKRENEILRQDIVNTDELLAENMRLRALLEYKRNAVHFDFITAQVVARDPGSWTDTITVNQGASEGIVKNMVVVNEQGLIGSVVSVYPHTSKIQLIIDPRSAVGALVQRTESRVAGIVEGNSSSINPNMVNLAKDADIVAGDRIITSGFGGIYPKGLIVGEVTEIVDNNIGFLKNAVIKTAVSFGKLEEVLIIKNFREIDPVPGKNKPLAKEAGR